MPLWKPHSDLLLSLSLAIAPGPPTQFDYRRLYGQQFFFCTNLANLLAIVAHTTRILSRPVPKATAAARRNCHS